MNADNTFELSINCYINAKPEKVWAVMTTRLPEWWCPKPWRTEVHALEWQSGGKFDTTMHGPEPGQVASAKGVVLEVVPEKRFVFTDALDSQWNPQKAFMVGRFEVEAEGSGTRYTASARHWNEEDSKSHQDMGFEGGWSAVALQLKELAETE